MLSVPGLDRVRSGPFTRNPQRLRGRQALLDSGVFFLGVGDGDGLLAGAAVGAWTGVGIGRGRHERRVEDLGQDAAVHVGGDGDAQQVEDRRGDVEQVGPVGRRPGAERRAGGDEDPLHPVVAGRAERRGDQLVGREVVQADRPVPPVARGPPSGRGRGAACGPVVELLALVDPLDQRLARLGVGDRQQAGLQVVEQRRGRPRGRRTPAAAGPSGSGRSGRNCPGRRPASATSRCAAATGRPTRARRSSRLDLLAPEPARPAGSARPEPRHQAVEPLGRHPALVEPVLLPDVERVLEARCRPARGARR